MALFPTGLFEYTIKSAFWNIEFWMSCNGDAQSRFIGINQLSMTSVLSNYDSSLVMQAFKTSRTFMNKV